MQDKEKALYSRQIFALGADAMGKLSSGSCLISGMNGAGVEIAKNVILSGVKTVVVHDVESTTFQDLSTQFYLTEEDIGKNRAESCVTKLSELNEYVQVHCLSVPLTEDVVAKFKVVVLVNRPESEIQTISNYCRKHNVKFIVADSAGLFCRLFIDDGPEHTVTDPDGATIKSYPIGSIMRGEKTLIQLVAGETHDLGDGDRVSFSLVEGMTELNELKLPTVEVKNRTSFYINADSRAFHEYTQNGYVTKIVLPTTLCHKPYAEEVKDPHLVENGDFMHMTRPATLHCCFLAMDEFRKTHAGALPHPHNEKDAAEFVEIVKKIHADLFAKSEDFMKQTLDEEIVPVFARICAGSTAPITSSIGGIIGQEIIKAVTNKLTPLSQWLYLDNTQCLDFNALPSEEDAAPQNNRYDGQVAIFGKAFQAKLATLKVFLVGAGAIGCEALKNLALMGVASGSSGLITVTDMDNIELSNLSRQFLFRQKDMQKPKSETAAVSIKTINPSINVKPLTLKVCTSTENIFNSDFWNSLDLVANALDNVAARLYVDTQCVRYSKPLFECGTLGTQGNTQSVIPHLTENYGNSTDAGDTSYPLCTLKNFPYLIEHTIEYARGLFVELFSDQLTLAASYIRDPAATIKKLRNSKVERINMTKNLVTNIVERPQNFDDCIRWAKRLFMETFSNQIQQLLFSFPPDYKMEGGIPFWTEEKRLPDAIPFDSSNPLHIAFLIDAAFIRATGYNLPIPSSFDTAAIAKVADDYKLPPFVPSLDVKIDVGSKTDKAAAPSSSEKDDSEEFEKLLKCLPPPQELQGLTISPIDFEKDDDSNHHIDFITDCTNLRAMNYHIPIAERSKVQFISGQIIPALATTTGLISGLTMCDLLTYEHGVNDIDRYHSWFINLAINTYVVQEPLPPPYIGDDKKFTIWDQIHFDLSAENPNELTLGVVMDKLNAAFNWHLEMVNAGPYILFMVTKMKPKKAMYEARLQKPIQALLAEVSKGKIAPDTTDVTLIVFSSNQKERGKAVDCPPVHLILPQPLAE